MKRNLCISIILAYFLISCEQKTEWDFQPDHPFVVADCIITNEFRRHEVRLSWSTDTLNQSVTGYSGAAVTISDGLNEVSFFEDPGIAGRYVSEQAFRATVGKQYRLTIEWSGGSDAATAVMVPLAPIKEIEIFPSDGYYRYSFNENHYPCMMEISYNWSADATYCSTYGSCQASEVFYHLNNLDAGKIFAPDKQVILFPKQTQIIRRKYSLSDDHQEFIRSLLLETEWRGGVFDTEQANVPTNFSNGLRGWFGACMVATDTLMFVDF